MKNLIPTTKNVKTVTDMRENAVQLLNQLKNEGPTYILHQSKPKAVMLSIQECEKILERIEDLEDELVASTLHEEALNTPLEDLIALEDLQKKYLKAK